MGSYGIGPGRVMAAAVEQHHDENGIVWPRAIAPYDAHVVALAGAEEIARAGGAGAVGRPGSTCCSTTATCAPGEKFADADLIGCPIRVTAGKKSLEDGKVDVRDRTSGEEQRLAVADLGKRASRWRAGDGSARSPSGRRSRPDDGGRRDLPRARCAHGALRRISQPPRARQPAGAVERRRARRSRRRSASRPSTSGSTGSA